MPEIILTIDHPSNNDPTARLVEGSSRIGKPSIFKVRGGYLACLGYPNCFAAHYENRLTYERAMLEDQGGSDLLAPRPRPKQLPIANYRGEGGVIVHREPLSAW